ncbi:MAG: phosphatidylserine decarboxylase family protein [Bacteroidales bacterium]|jgi:phosphatidylserine decarboxylase|nr:phosphatidylserine decarboxylase family protein [Bacteroidales bacterium]
MKYYIHKEGTKIITILFILFGAASTVALLFLPLWAGITITVICTLLWLAVISFFRVPRCLQSRFDKEDIVAPADGKIVNISKVYEKEFFKDERLLISIFMSPANVHINRFPIDGIVHYVKYHAGKYLVAFHEKSSELNERSTVVIETEQHQILVRQIAGAVARRIACYAKPQQKAIRCAELGFIRFGSRVDTYLPLTAKPTVELNQKVKGGITVIAKL